VDVDEPEKRSLGAPLHQSRSHAWDDGNFARRARAPVGPDEEIVLICGQGVFSKALVAVSQQRFGNMLLDEIARKRWPYIARTIGIGMALLGMTMFIMH
jgi:hypothetical protein